MQPDRLITHARKLPIKGAIRVVLYLVGIDDAEAEPLGEWTVSDYEGDLLKDLATEIYQCAQFDVDERRGQRRYRVLANDDNEKEVYRWTMRMEAADDKSEAAANTDKQGSPTMELDEPTAQGLLAQAMRHQERQFTVCMASQERIVRSLQDQLTSRDKRIQQLEGREVEVMETLRALRLNNLEGLGAERTADRIDKALTLLTEKFLPAAGIQLGILPEGFDTSKPLDQLKQVMLKPAADTSAPIRPPSGDDS